MLSTKDFIKYTFVLYLIFNRAENALVLSTIDNKYSLCYLPKIRQNTLVLSTEDTKYASTEDIHVYCIFAIY